MRIAILGFCSNKSLSLQTKDVIARLQSLENIDLTIDLLLLDEKANSINMSLPHNVSVKIYRKIRGTSDQAKYLAMLDHYIKNHKIDLLIVALDSLNEDLVPLLSERVKMVGYCDCLGLEYCSSQNIYSLLKPEYSGNVTAYYKIMQPTVCSFRYQKTSEDTDHLLGEVRIEYIDYELELEDTVQSRKFTKSSNKSIEDADLVIVCGYGVGNKENMKEIISYANKIGASVCGTKKIVDLGWLPMNLLIGQTGHIISPSTCITIGVSGAAPLLHGIVGSKCIIAVNSDKDARIFSYADYGIVGDYKTVLSKGLSHNENDERNRSVK